MEVQPRYSSHTQILYQTVPFPLLNPFYSRILPYILPPTLTPTTSPLLTSKLTNPPVGPNLPTPCKSSFNLFSSSVAPAILILGTPLQLRKSGVVVVVCAGEADAVCGVGGTLFEEVEDVDLTRAIEPAIAAVSEFMLGAFVVANRVAAFGLGLLTRDARPWTLSLVLVWGFAVPLVPFFSTCFVMTIPCTKYNILLLNSILTSLATILSFSSSALLLHRNVPTYLFKI